MTEQTIVHEVALAGYKATSTGGMLDLGTWGSYGIEKLHLTLDAAWQDLTITAFFNVKGEVVAKKVVGKDGYADVPWEATKENTLAGRIVFEGSINSRRRISANLNYKVTNHSEITDSDPVPTDDRWNQFVTENKEYRDGAFEAAERANARAEDAEAASDDAQAAARAAKASETAANASKNAAATSEDNARISAGAAAVSDGNAAASADKAKASETAAAESTGKAAASEKAAAASAVAAAGSAAQAETQKTAAAKSASDAQGYMQTASSAATAANASAENAAGSKAAAASSATAAAGSATAAAGDAKTASDAAAVATDAKAAAVAAQKDAEASKAAAAKNAADANRTANSINDSMTQIAKNKEAIRQLKDGKISKFFASSQGDTNLPDSDDGRIVDLKLYGKSEQKQYKGVNLLPTGISYDETTEVSIPKGTHIFWATDGTPALGGNFKFLNEDKTQEMWFGVDAGKTAMTITASIDAKYVDFLILKNQEVKICLGIGDDPVYEPYTGGIPSPSPDYPQEIKRVVNPTVKVTNKDELKVQSVTLNNITLNAIPVSSGGNVTIGEQQYISDYLDIDKGKLYRKVKRLNLKDAAVTNITHGFHSNGNGYLSIAIENTDKDQSPISNRYKGAIWTATSGYVYVPNSNSIVLVDNRFTDKQTAIKLVQDTYVIYALSSPTEEDLSLEQIKSLKSLSTNYPVTNITVGSEELDGYAVFNYPVSMDNGWNYVKQQLSDNRDYIYDMDLQSAEAYVNSEYAVALTELEV